MSRMNARWLVGVLVAASAVSLGAQAARQSSPPVPLPGGEAVKALIAARTQKNWTPTKTPWGDPDLQGVFTTKDEANTPFERPAEWAGRKIDDITPAELAEAVVRRQQDAVESAPFAGGGEPEQGVAIAVPIHWFDSLTSQNSRPWFVIDPPDGTVPAVTTAGRTKAIPSRGPNGGQRNTYLDRNSADRCITQTWRGPGLYGNSLQIVQTPDYVVFRREQIHEARVFRLKHPKKLDEKVRVYQGDGVAHWEGNTLVVEVTNFHENQDFRGYPTTNLRLIERFTRISPKQVEWSVTVDDPSIWSRHWTYSMPMTQDETQIIHEYACHEGNYGMANLLSAGRTSERAAKPKP